MAGIGQWFANALRFHKAGELEDAEALYRKVLKRHPRHVDANSLLGALLLQKGQLDLATRHLEKAVRLQPTHFIAHNNLGHVYHDQGRLDQAIAEYRKAIELRPTFVEAMNNLGCALREQGRLAEAKAAFERLLAVDGQYPPGYYNLGLVYKERGAIEQAVELYEQALERQPDYVEARYQLANAYRDQDRLQDAIVQYEQVLDLRPHHFFAITNLGVARQKAGQLEAAFALYRRALELNAQDADAHVNLGAAYVESGELEQGLACYEEALRRRPDDPLILSNLANALTKLERNERAESVCRQALELAPACWEAHLNLGVACYKQGRFDAADREFKYCLHARPDDPDALTNLGSVLYLSSRLPDAVACYDRILSQRSRDPWAHWNRGLALLGMGRLAPGWEEYDWGTQTKERALARRYTFPMWSGTAISNDAILVYAEQGLGDEILFASCLPDLIRRAGRVVVQCDPRLAPLYARSFPEAVVHGGARDEDPTWLQTLGTIDWQLPIGSLPRYLRRTLEEFPKKNDFLIADGGRRTYWRERLAALGAGLKVGLAWRSSLRTALRSLSYIGIEHLEPLLRETGITFVNLQYDECREELAQIRERFGIQVHAFDELDLFNDLDESCALMAELDLVICPAIATYNIAAGVGTPTWVLRPHGTPWMLLGTEELPWYPAVRVFRQPLAGDWDGAIAEATTALRATLAGSVGSSMGSLEEIETRYGPMHGVVVEAGAVSGRDRVAWSLRLYGEYAEGEVVLLRQLVKPGAQVVDLAAHLGELTLPLAGMVGVTGGVTAYEPEPSAYQMLCANVTHNGLTQVRPCAAPLAGAMDGGQTAVPVALDAAAVTGCDLIRVGQGGDPLALLSGAREAIRRYKPFLFFEDVSMSERDQVQRMLQTLGYAVLLHPVPLYNPQNFHGNRENPWGNTVLQGLLGYPLP